MDPITITCAVVTLSAKCLNTAKTLHSFKERYQDAPLTILSIASQCTAMSASLGYVQALALKKPEAMQSSLDSRSELVDLFDTCLTGCVIVLSIVDSEVQKLNDGSNTVGKRVELLWKEGRMKGLLSHIERQQTALTLLTQALQLEKLDEMSKLVKNNQTKLEAISQNTLSLRAENPTIQSPTSIMHLEPGDNESVFSFASSFASSTQFDFDDLVVNSSAYKRSLASLRRPLPIQEKDGETKKAKDVIKVEERYNARLQALSQKCVDTESALQAAVAELNRVVKNKDEIYAWYSKQKRKWTDQQEHDRDSIETLSRELDIARAVIADKDQALTLLQADHVVAGKTEQWMASFTKAFSVLNHQYNEIVPEVDLLRQRNKDVLQKLMVKEQAELVYQEEVESLRKKFAKAQEAEKTIKSNWILASDELHDIKEQLRDVKHRYSVQDQELKQQREQLDAKEEEIGKYKRYDAILDQLRAITTDETSESTTPNTPASTPATSPNTSDVGHRRSPIRDVQSPAKQQLSPTTRSSRYDD